MYLCLRLFRRLVYWSSRRPTPCRSGGRPRWTLDTENQPVRTLSFEINPCGSAALSQHGARPRKGEGLPCRLRGTLGERKPMLETIGWMKTLGDCGGPGKGGAENAIACSRSTPCTQHDEDARSRVSRPGLRDQSIFRSCLGDVLLGTAGNGAGRWTRIQRTA